MDLGFRCIDHQIFVGLAGPPRPAQACRKEWRLLAGTVKHHTRRKKYDAMTENSLVLLHVAAALFSSHAARRLVANL